MKTNVISLPTNNQKIYRQILAFMNFRLNLSAQQRDVLAEIIRLDAEYEVLPQDKRAKFILSTDMRKEICGNVKISDKQFNVVLNTLKKKTLAGKLLLDENNFLHPELNFKPDEEGYKIEVNFIKTNIPTTTSELSSLNKSEIIEEIPSDSFEKEFKDASKNQVLEEEDFDITILPAN